MSHVKLLIAGLLLLPTSLLAQGHIYGGIKAGTVFLKFVDSSTPAGAIDYSASDTGKSLLLGYRFNKIISAEFEHVSSVIDTDNVTYSRFALESDALYATFKNQGSIFGKIRIGMLKEKVTRREFYSGDQSTTDEGISYGFGGGYEFDNFLLELDYTHVETDINFISVGVSYKFYPRRGQL